MTVTSGFFNSLNYDRLYNATEMSQLFDGVIEDGVYANIYNQFKVTANEGMTIQVDTGRSWFNHAWTLNDSILLLQVPTAEILFDRIDAVVNRIDHTESVRKGDIVVVKGTPSSDPQKPTLQNGPEVFEHPLAYVRVRAESTSVTQADITNMVGTSECPFVVGAAKSLDVDLFVAQLQSQWDNWFNKTSTKGEKELRDWMSQNSYEFNLWFNSLQTMLDGDIATKLASEILQLQEKWKVLAREYTVYDTIDDDENNAITDENGDPIEGGIVYVIKNERG